MKEFKAIIATTHIDRQFERLTKGALEGMAENIKQAYVPVWVEHDIARLPIGRTISADVVELEDGEFGLTTISECWEDTDNPNAHRGDGRKLILAAREEKGVHIGFDISFRDEKGIEIVRELSAITGERGHYEGKKSLTVLSQLTIAAGIFALGGIAGGFFQALGADAYEKLKGKLKSIRSHPANEKASRILARYTVQNGENRIEANIVLDNATPEMIDRFFDNGMEQLDAICKRVVEKQPDVARIVTKQEAEEVQYLYHVRDDGFPFIEWDK